MLAATLRVDPEGARGLGSSRWRSIPRATQASFCLQIWASPAIAKIPEEARPRLKPGIQAEPVTAAAALYEVTREGHREP